jgi:hypothetical protein
MTEQLRKELEALRQVSRQKAADTRQLAQRLEAVIAAIVGRPQASLHDSGDAYDVLGSSGPPTSGPFPLHSAMPSDEQEAQLEALERLQAEMREHVADAAALADRIAALQARIDTALAELAKGTASDQRDL